MIKLSTFEREGWFLEQPPLPEQKQQCGPGKPAPEWCFDSQFLIGCGNFGFRKSQILLHEQRCLLHTLERYADLLDESSTIKNLVDPHSRCCHTCQLSVGICRQFRRARCGALATIGSHRA